MIWTKWIHCQINICTMKINTSHLFVILPDVLRDNVVNVKTLFFYIFPHMLQSNMKKHLIFTSSQLVEIWNVALPNIIHGLKPGLKRSSVKSLFDLTCTLVQHIRQTLAKRWRCGAAAHTLHVRRTRLAITELQRRWTYSSCSGYKKLESMQMEILPLKLLFEFNQPG